MVVQEVEVVLVAVEIDEEVNFLVTMMTSTADFKVLMSGLFNTDNEH